MVKYVKSKREIDLAGHVIDPEVPVGANPQLDRCGQVKACCALFHSFNGFDLSIDGDHASAGPHQSRHPDTVESLSTANIKNRHPWFDIGFQQPFRRLEGKSQGFPEDTIDPASQESTRHSSFPNSRLTPISDTKGSDGNVPRERNFRMRARGVFPSHVSWFQNNRSAYAVEELRLSASRDGAGGGDGLREA